MHFDIRKMIGRTFRSMALLGLLLSAASMANAAPPSIALSLNAPNYVAGNTMNLSVSTVAGTPSVTSDVYIALQLPNGTLLYMQSNGSFSTALSPFVSSITLPALSNLPIFNYKFTGAEPTGTYTWFAALMQPATMNMIGTIASASFTFPTVTPPTLSVAAASVIEGNAGTSNLVFTVTLSAASANSVTVNYGTTDGTARAGSDYTATNGVLTIAAGATTGTVTVFVSGDTVNEPDETLTLMLSNPINATIAAATAIGTIINDDVAPAAPTGVSAIGYNGYVTISWAPVATATSYNIYWGTTTGVTPATGTKVAGAISGNAVMGLVNGTTYFFIVTAVNAAGESMASTEATAVPAIILVSHPPSLPIVGTATAISGTYLTQGMDWSGVNGGVNSMFEYTQTISSPNSIATGINTYNDGVVAGNPGTWTSATTIGATRVIKRVNNITGDVSAVTVSLDGQFGVGLGLLPGQTGQQQEFFVKKPVVAFTSASAILAGSYNLVGTSRTPGNPNIPGSVNLVVTLTPGANPATPGTYTLAGNTRITDATGNVVTTPFPADSGTFVVDVNGILSFTSLGNPSAIIRAAVSADGNYSTFSYLDPVSRMSILSVAMRQHTVPASIANSRLLYYSLYRFNAGPDFVGNVLIADAGPTGIITDVNQSRSEGTVVCGIPGFPNCSSTVDAPFSLTLGANGTFIANSATFSGNGFFSNNGEVLMLENPGIGMVVYLKQ